MYQVYLKNAPISAKYDCGIKAEYQKDLMGLVEEDMILAVKNFKTKLDGNNNTSLYTLLVASRIWPEHYGLRAISEHTYYPIQFEVIGQSVSDWGTYDKATMMIQISSIPVNYDLVVNNTTITTKQTRTIIVTTTNISKGSPTHLPATRPTCLALIL
jgi:hypothetical protein